MAGPYDFSGAFANLNSSLANLGKQFQANREREAFGAIGQGLADGSLDYRKAAGSLAQLGRLDAAIDLVKLGDAQRQRLAGEEAARSLGTAIGGLNIGGAGAFPASAPTATGSALPAALNTSESGGNWQAQNNEVGAGGAVGHFGRAQFGQARLQEAANAGAIPQGTTPQQFMQSPQLQRAAENWHFADIDKFIAGNGLNRVIGQSINGVPVTADGMRMVAHLGGKQGLQKFIETGGRYIRATPTAPR